MARSSGLVLLILALGSASHAAAQPPERDGPAPEPSHASRVTLGINGAPLVEHVGLHLRFEHAAVEWEHGEVTVGAQLASHFYLPRSSAPPDVDYSSFDTSIRLHAFAGHVFTFASRHLRLGLYAFGGPSLRVVESSLRDRAHGIQRSHEQVEPLFELGAMLVIGWRITEDFGVNVSLAVPLWVSGSDHIMASWLAVPPFLGASASVYF